MEFFARDVSDREQPATKAKRRRVNRRALRVAVAFGVIALVMQLRSVGNRTRTVLPVVSRGQPPAPSWVPRPASGGARLYTAGGVVVLPGDTKRGRK
jgi:hypothetical protein